MALYGYDLSVHQGNLDLSRLKPTDFVILRAGYAGWGNPAVSYKDGQFENFYAQARKLGLKIGAYFYAPCLNESQALQEARAFASYLSGKQFDLPVYMDVEDNNNGQMMLPSDKITRMVEVFCDEMERQGYFAGVYSTKYLLENKIKTDAYTKWVAAWGTNSGNLEFRLENYPLHQFTSMSYVDGLRLDKNILYDQSLLSVIKEKGFNGFKKSETAVKTYIVQPNDTLSEIAQRYQVSVESLVLDNQIADPDLIYPGQKLKIR